MLVWLFHRMGAAHQRIFQLNEHVFDMIWVEFGVVGFGFQENSFKVRDGFVNSFMGFLLGSKIHLLVQKRKNNFFL